MKILINFFVLTSLLFAMSAKPKIYQDFHMAGIKTTEQAVSAKDIEKALIEAGIVVVSNEDINQAFIKEFKSSEFDVYNVITFYHKEISPALLKDHPDAGLFYPSTLVVFQRKNDPILWTAFLSSRTMSKVLNLKYREKLLANFDRSVLKALISLLKKPRFKQVNSSQLRQVRTLALHQKAIKNSELKNLQAKFEISIKNSKFKLKASTDLNKVLGDKSVYDFYMNYQLSKLETLYVNSKLYPESAAHTPFNIIMYKKKGSRYLTVTQSDIAHAIDSSDITETASLKALSRDQKEINDLINEALK